MESAISKSVLRKSVLQYRKLLGQESYLQRNNRLLSSVKEFLEVKKVQSIHTFLSMDKSREPDVSPLFKKLWSEDVRLVVSKIDFKLKQLCHYYVDDQTVLVENKMGIPEPANGEEASIDDLDLILVPLLVSDKEGYRIGYGGGYYDRLLKETKALKVGLSLSPPVDEILQREEWDIPLDYLITPFKTYNYG
ncbi:5-formyltetrahydrofolate cyclo-ligase [Ekhidna sp.]|jgi:5-formyltetrahydrofolate cyclo-ligase|uniref:5-formyltetrahydrofolate cyclo-ligase n=1 Tax=Ekhidna sp. TaxID=2608089 RepID=UPI0032EB3C7C